MTYGPVDFVGGYTLNFAWKGRKKMFDLLGVRTHVQFINLLNSADGTPDDMYEKIVYAGLFAKHPELKLEHNENDPEGTIYVEDLIDQYFLEGGDQRQFDDLIIDALVNAGLMNREQIIFSRKMRQARNREDIKKLLDLLDQTFAKAEDVANTPDENIKGDDPGESPGSSQPISTT